MKRELPTQLVHFMFLLLACAVCVGCIPMTGSHSSSPSPAHRATPSSTPAHEPRLAYCKSSIDCDGSRFCKDRGDGIKLCMGDGGAGAYCKSAIDCEGSRFCKDRGDGLKVCM